MENLNGVNCGHSLEQERQDSNPLLKSRLKDRARELMLESCSLNNNNNRQQCVALGDFAVDDNVELGCESAEGQQQQQQCSNKSSCPHWSAHCVSCQESGSQLKEDVAAAGQLSLSECAGAMAVEEDKGGGAAVSGGYMLEQNTGDWFALAVNAVGGIGTAAAAAGLSYGLAGAEAPHSNRTSLNNSTENLSYSSDYADDLILLDVGENDEDLDMSDDCIYAYRGDFEHDLEGRRAGMGCLSMAGSVGDAGIADDETDFLEMDFEPDPLSEWEYDVAGGSNRANAATGESVALVSPLNAALPSDAYYSSMHAPLNATATQLRQLLSSPIDDLPPAKALNAQSALCKNYGRITCAHLDQINSHVDDEADLPANTAAHLTMLNSTCSAGEAGITTSGSLPTVTAYSLPSSAGFGRPVEHVDLPLASGEATKSPSKVTGAKPKRLSTFSTSSSTSSKNSSKSRSSLRSTAFTPARNSVSLDERSVSCTDFRAGDAVLGNLQHLSATGAAAAAAHATNSSNLNSCLDYGNDDACLDCLEREFLANTIGKIMEPHECNKCRKRNSSSASLALYSHAEQARCRSGSPSFFHQHMRNEEFLYADGATITSTNKQLKCEFMSMPRDSSWMLDNLNCSLINGVQSASDKSFLQLSAQGYQQIDRLNSKEQLRTASTSTEQNIFLPKNAVAGFAAADVATVAALHKTNTDIVAVGVANNQRRAMCDNFEEEEQLLKNLKLTDKEIATISTMNISEDNLVQALDKLQVSYDLELIKNHFKALAACAVAPPTGKPLRSLKEFLLHESKKQGNHPKLKRLIERATQNKLQVQFTKNTNPSCSTTQMLPIKTHDILHYWTHDKNLEDLKHLDKRFEQANVLGKIANIIRQTQQRPSTRRALPEFVLIPQYYEDGHLTLTKTC